MLAEYATPLSRASPTATLPRRRGGAPQDRIRAVSRDVGSPGRGEFTRQAMFPGGWRFSCMRLVHVRDLLEREGLREAGIDLPGRDQVVSAPAPVVVREVRALEAFLPQSRDSEGRRPRCTRSYGADDDIRRVADEDRGRRRWSRRMLEDDPRFCLDPTTPRAQREGASALEPFPYAAVSSVRQPSPSAPVRSGYNAVADLRYLWMRQNASRARTSRTTTRRGR